MGIKDYIRKRFLSKSFRIELGDKYCFSNDKNFIFPNSMVVCKAIEKHVATTGETLEFIQREKPKTFLLDGKIYRAELTTGYYIFSLGYFIKCTSVAK